MYEIAMANVLTVGIPCM